jgi:hypothetical protein
MSARLALEPAIIEMVIGNANSADFERMPAHAVAAGQLDEQAGVVEVGQAVLQAVGIQALEQRRDGRVEADLLAVASALRMSLAAPTCGRAARSRAPPCAGRAVAGCGCRRSRR